MINSIGDGRIRLNPFVISSDSTNTYVRLGARKRITFARRSINWTVLSASDQIEEVSGDAPIVESATGRVC